MVQQEKLARSSGYYMVSAASPKNITKKVSVVPLFTQDSLAVITPYFNPWRWKSRARLYFDFAEYMEKCGVQLFTIEVAFGDREFEVTSAQNPYHIQLRTSHELWYKERMINLALFRLPLSYHVAWIDADVKFARTDWPMETIHLLQHYSIIQMFSDAVDLDPNHNHHRINHGFVKTWVKAGRPDLHEIREIVKSDPKIGTKYVGRGVDFSKVGPVSGHPGFAWAARRDVLDQTGGIYDKAILGSGDRHVALAVLGAVELSAHAMIESGYSKSLLAWQERCSRHIKKNMGYMEGLLTHCWHGKKVDRKYRDRWEILVKHKYDPDIHLGQDSQGLWRWNEEATALSHDIREYFQQRNEDSIDIE